MVKKGDPGAPAPEPVLPDLPDAVPAEHLTVPAGLDFSNFDFAAAGSPHRWADYEAGERIDPGDAMTIQEAEHQMATRPYQNTERVHSNHTPTNNGTLARP